MPLLLDVQYAMASEALSNRGVSRRALNEAKSELIRVEGEFAEAIRLGLLPMFIDAEVKINKALEFSDSFEEYDQVWIVGEESVIRSLQICADSNKNYVWVSSLSPELMEKVTEVENKLLIVLTGSSWVFRLTSLITQYFSSVIQCIGDGTDPDRNSMLSDADVLHEAGIADMRFSMFSSIGLALQQNTQKAVEKYRKVVVDLQQTGMWENSSSLLACCLFALDTNTHPTQLILIGARGSWQNWLNWGAQIWAGMASQVYSYGAMTKRIDSRVCSFVLGDELGMNVLGACSSNSMICLMEERNPLLHEPTDLTLSVWDMSHSLIESLLSYSQKNALPLCVCEVQKMSGEDLLSLSAGWIHSILVLNALRGADPLAMWGADQWRLFDSGQ
jgi:hypothetical protein